ncbi:hypothetical protein N802_09800 [Knoellia sinensis KCTC 19936]|uniref:Arginase n=1 Tax=Knoellia sinensis KCTC 19936 TaxID=1385520 RepID=A0A0A0J1Y0_9MICO|nr:arginase family protein [Knoellia sinensis]KGN30157.1 hypothetical protein N802_09800 [Knoellia sinensis KCTC 19936]
MVSPWKVLNYVGPAGDHNDHAMSASPDVAAALAERLAVAPQVIGTPGPAEPQRWDGELVRARADLQLMAGAVDDALASGARPALAITRCAVALATQPVVLRHRPDAVVVWLDAHADINVPDNSDTGFLGGMALSGPLGWWDSGFGGGLPEGQAILVGCRDIDPAEQAHLDAGRVAFVAPGPGIGDRLAEAIDGRPVYFHLDCDVLEPGLVRTDYSVSEGLTFEDLRACAAAAAGSEVVGFEVGEFEGAASRTAADLVEALSPLFT